MLNKSTDQLIIEYLSELKQALKGQDQALIQDAQYDAEEHLRAALEEANDPVSESEKSFSSICDDYGSAEEIAEYYRDMEAKVNLALNGSNRRVSTHPYKRFFSIFFDTNTYTSLLYLMLVLPLSIGYFAWLAMAGLTSLTLSLALVGIPLLLLFLTSMSFFSYLEGRLVEALLRQRMPRRPKYQHQYENKTWKARVLATLSSKRYWATVLYLLLQLPLGFIYVLCVTVPFILSVVVFISPIVDPLLHFIDPVRYQIDIDWYWFPLAMPGGVIGFMLTLYLARLLGQLHARLARFLLVSIITDD